MAAIQMFNKSANLANCLAACRIAITLPAGMADLEAMARAIANSLTSLKEIPLESSAGWHPASNRYPGGARNHAGRTQGLYRSS
jgi:hypothetical protein